MNEIYVSRTEHAPNVQLVKESLRCRGREVVVKCKAWSLSFTDYAQVHVLVHCVYSSLHNNTLNKPLTTQRVCTAQLISRSCVERFSFICFWSHYPLAKVGYTSKSKRTNYKTKTQTKLSACLVQVLSAGWCIPRTPRARQQPQAQWHRRWRPTTSPRKSQPRTASRGRARRHRRTRCR